MKLTRKSLVLALTALLVAAGVMVSRPSAAFTVYCANCGTEWTQLFNKMQLIQQVEAAMQQLHTMLQTYQNLVQNTTPVPDQIWGNAMRDIAQVNALIQQSRALAYSAANLEEEFLSRYGDYRMYSQRTMSVSDWDTKYDQWSQETRDNVLYALRAAGLQASQMNDEDMTMQALQALSQTAQGRMQAIQVGNQLAAQSVRQTQKLRQLMMLQLQMQADYIAAQADKEAMQRAAMRQFTAPVTVPVNDGERF